MDGDQNGRRCQQGVGEQGVRRGPYLEALRRGLGVGDVAVGVVLEGRLAVAGVQRRVRRGGR